MRPPAVHCAAHRARSGGPHQKLMKRIVQLMKRIVQLMERVVQLMKRIVRNGSSAAAEVPDRYLALGNGTDDFGRLTVCK